MKNKCFAGMAFLFPKIRDHLIYVIKLFLILSFGGMFAAVVINSASAEETPQKTKRIEASYSFENLRPHDTYGNWHTGSLSFYHNPFSGFTYFVNGSFHGRAEGNDNAATIGAYKDWTASLYTYTSIGTADRSTYLPRFRIDNDFNFKIGSQKNVVLTFGVTSIDYFTGYKDLIVSAGPTIYWHQFIGQYRFFYNQSDPDDIYSHSHLFRLGYGKEGRQWTFIGYSFGNQAYMASPMINRQEVNNDSWEAILQHRHWLNSNYGIFGSISFFKLDNGYEKTGVCFGVFYEF